MKGRTTPREALRGGTAGDALADFVATSALMIFSELRFALMPLAFASACSSFRLLSSSDLHQAPSDTTTKQCRRQSNNQLGRFAHDRKSAMTLVLLILLGVQRGFRLERLVDHAPSFCVPPRGRVLVRVATGLLVR